MSVKYPRKIRLTVVMHNKEVLESLPVKILTEKEEQDWANLLRKPKDIAYLAIARAGALGGEDTVFINPTYISHIIVTDVQE